MAIRTLLTDFIDLDVRQSLLRRILKWPRASELEVMRDTNCEVGVWLSTNEVLGVPNP